MGEQRRVTLHVHGRVQGVFFRANARTVGTRLGLHGWVRNCCDGAVQVTAEGPADAIEDLLAWCRHGPPAACVERVEAALVAEDDSVLPSGFEIRF